jgi:hypothetical protein
MRRRSVGSASACCKFESRLGIPWRLPLLSEDEIRIQEEGPRRMVKDEGSVIVMYEGMLTNNKFQKSGIVPPNLFYK